MSDAVIETFPLGFQWPTFDPFLFCVHHLDRYPNGNEQMGPDASLAGRDLGQDFAGVDGWRMYHGTVVPGFPGHPHRGFETVTYVRQGLIDHADSLGAAARYGRGDVQWLTAGEGIVHSEMFPLLDREHPNTLELFQIWLNLARDDKMAPPHFDMLWAHDIPLLSVKDDDGRTVQVTVIAGALEGLTPPPPPPHSWASRSDADVAIWHVRMEPGARWTLPAARGGASTARTLYVFEGSSLSIDGRDIGAPTGARVHADRSLTLTAGADETEVLVLQGRPIDEPIAQYGPFVLNDRAGIQKAFNDYQRTGFGGWPWDSEYPVHGRDQGRFARNIDGHVETVES
jgi:quercetin 2,3-dioxygenase